MNTFPLSYLLNCFRKGHDRINGKYQTVLWFAGLRGAIALALATKVAGHIHDVILISTLCIVIFTVLVFGGMTVCYCFECTNRRFLYLSG